MKYRVAGVIAAAFVFFGFAAAPAKAGDDECLRYAHMAMAYINEQCEETSGKATAVCSAGALGGGFMVLAHCDALHSIP